MLLNAWLSAARRQFLSANSRRVNRIGAPRVVRMESLEERALLSGIPTVNTLVINPDNVTSYLNAAGGLEVDNADMAGKDGLVIEGLSVSATSGNAINVDLSGIALQRFAIESVNVTQFTGLGINVKLANVTGLDSVAVEDVTVIKRTTEALNFRFINTDTNGFTIDDSTLPGIVITAEQGSDLRNGVVTESTITAPQGVQGVTLNVLSTPGGISTADGFRIINNANITTDNGDAVQVNATGYVDSVTKNTVSRLDGLTIANNAVGTREGANVSFRAQGDTFIQPFVLTNNSTGSDLLQTFTLDLAGIGLQFDPDAVTGKPFTAIGTS
ncbi:MAG: hypothetical protein ACK58L_13575, partial [Planctomycetota bacterium]